MYLNFYLAVLRLMGILWLRAQGVSRSSCAPEQQQQQQQRNTTARHGRDGSQAELREWERESRCGWRWMNVVKHPALGRLELLSCLVKGDGNKTSPCQVEKDVPVREAAFDTLQRIYDWLLIPCLVGSLPAVLARVMKHRAPGRAWIVHHLGFSFILVSVLLNSTRRCTRLRCTSHGCSALLMGCFGFCTRSFQTKLLLQIVFFCSSGMCLLQEKFPVGNVEMPQVVECLSQKHVGMRSDVHKKWCMVACICNFSAGVRAETGQSLGYSSS